MSGKRYNEHCCFDYGNSEDTLTAGKDYGCGAMEAIYFGDSRWVPHSPWTAPDGNRGQGSGPWVGADLEAGMYYGGGNRTRVNEQNTPLTSDFVSLSLKGREDGFALKGGDATRGSLKTMYGPLDYRTAARTLFLRPHLAHFCSFFRRFFAVLSVLTPGFQKVALEDRGAVPQRSKTAAKRVGRRRPILGG